MTTRATLAIAIVWLGAGTACAQDLVLLARGTAYAGAWQTALAEVYGIEAEIADRPAGRTQIQRDASAQRIVAGRGLAVWLEEGELRAISGDSERASASPLAGRDAASLARATILVMDGGSAPLIAEVADFDRDGERPMVHLSDPGPPPPPVMSAPRRRDENPSAPYGGLLATVLVVGGEGMAGGAGVRAVAGYRFGPYLLLGGYVDLGAVGGNDSGPFVRSCGELAVSYPWSTMALQLAGHACGAFLHVPDQSITSEHFAWTAGGAFAFSARVSDEARVWVRGEIDAMMAEGVEGLWFVPALAAGVTFE